MLVKSQRMCDIMETKVTSETLHINVESHDETSHVKLTALVTAQRKLSIGGFNG